MNKINLNTEAISLDEYWLLHNLGKINSHEINLIKIKDALDWHTHENEDKMFLVIDGILEIQFRNKTVELHKNECIIIPKGIENKPIAKNEATLLIFEPCRN